MIGDAKDNFFFGLYRGKDRVELGGGDDLVEAGAGADVLSGGPGTDTFWMQGGKAPDRPRKGGVTVDLSTNTDSDHDTLSGFEDIWGNLTGDDKLTGDDGPNHIFGLAGDDTISGLAGDDHLVGGTGTDTIDGGAGNDKCRSGEHLSNCESGTSRSRLSGPMKRAAALAELIDRERGGLRLSTISPRR
jgi:Ca2+-binding RTX toxin-like protein